VPLMTLLNYTLSLPLEGEARKGGEGIGREHARRSAPRKEEEREFRNNKIAPTYTG
jgi:hypothetical protein